MKKLFVLFILLGTIWLAYTENRWQQSYRFPDVMVPARTVISKMPGQGNVYSLSLQGQGYLDGRAEIVMMLNGSPYATEKMHGDVSFAWNGDWYADSAEIVYNPESVKYGHLTLIYTFKDIARGNSMPANFPAEQAKTARSNPERDTEWHRSKWQESPAIIQIDPARINLLFNRPEIVFKLRRAISFAPGDRHDYSDAVASTAYRVKSLEQNRAEIEYETRFADGSADAGAFVVSSRGE